MRFRRDRRGFIFSLDATLAMLVVMIVMAGVARVGGPGLVYGQHGYLRLERYANDALEVMQLTGTLDDVVDLVMMGENTEAEILARAELKKILPNEVQFRLVVGDNRLVVYPSDAEEQNNWNNAFASAEEIAVAARVMALGGLDQDNPNRTEGEWHEVEDGKWCAQSFIAGLTGDLTKVVLYLKVEGSPGELTIEVRDCTAENKPGSDNLARTTTSDVVSTTGEEYEFTFPSPAEVTAGTSYSIVLPELEGAGTYWWAEYRPSDGDIYPWGKVWLITKSGGSWSEGGGGRHDFYFRTYVGVPPENIFDFITLYVWRGAGT